MSQDNTPMLTYSRNKPRPWRAILWVGAVASLLVATTPAQSQQTSPSPERETSATGVVVSSTRNTLVVKGNDGGYQLFVFDRETVKPRTLPTGATVRVVSVPGEDAGVYLAREITVLTAAPATPPPAGAPTAGAQTPDGQAVERQTTQAVPPEVRRLERDIERQVRRYQLGVRTGVALDPELVLVGVHAQVGPFFSRDVFLRPNVEFAFGEVTALFGLNMEAIYRLPITSRQGRWSTYIGVGPGFSFIHQNFNPGGGSRIDFGDFHSSVGLNILGGLRFRSGTFMELKTSVYAKPAPTLSLIVGYNF